MPRRLFPLILLFAAVVSPAAERPAPVSIITREQLAARPVYSVAEALEAVPGVFIQRVGTVNTRAVARLRGAADTAATIVLFDGIPLNAAFDGEVDLSLIPFDIVERIEITRGGAPTAYTGEAAAGVINIITARPVEKGLDTTLGTGIGRDGAGNTGVRFVGRLPRAGDFSYAGNTRRAGGFINHEGSTARAHYGSYSRSFSGRGFWDVSYLDIESRVETPEGTPVAFDKWNGHLEREPANATAERRDRVRKAGGKLQEVPFLSGRLRAGADWTSHGREDRPTRSGAPTSDTDFTLQTFDAGWGIHGFDIGARRQIRRRQAFAGRNDRITLDAAHIEQRIAWGPLSMRPGIRWEDHETAGGTALPRFSLFVAKGFWGLSSSVQKAARYPTPDELYGASGNKNLDPETSVMTDVGATFGSRRFGLAVTGFTSRRRDVISLGAGSLYENTGRGRARGLESSLRAATGSDRPWKDVSLTATWTEMDSEVESAGRFVRAARVPRYFGSVELRQRLPRGLTWAHAVRWVGERHTGADHAGLRLPPYLRWDARVMIKILRADLYLAVENLSGERITDDDAGTGTRLSPQPRRTAWAGISIRFRN